MVGSLLPGRFLLGTPASRRDSLSRGWLSFAKRFFCLRSPGTVSQEYRVYLCVSWSFFLSPSLSCSLSRSLSLYLSLHLYSSLPFLSLSLSLQAVYLTAVSDLRIKRLTPPGLRRRSLQQGSTRRRPVRFPTERLRGPEQNLLPSVEQLFSLRY